MKGLIGSIETFDVTDNGYIDLSPNYEFVTFLRAELIIKSDSLEIKKVYNTICDFEIGSFIYEMMNILIKEDNITIESREYIKEGDKEYVKVKHFCFKELKEVYLNFKKQKD